jgi:hypothetical protein
MATWLGVITIILCSCLSVHTPIPPSPTPIPLTSTPTFDYPTAIPTSTFTPQPSPTPTPDLLSGLGKLIYSDYFNIDRGWEFGQSDIGGSSLINGRLSIALHQPNSFYYVRSPAPDISNFFLEVILRSEICTDNDELGVMFRLNTFGEHYRFSLTCDGGARVSRVIMDGETGLVPITQTYAVLPGMLVDNRLGVWAVGDTFRFFINGLEVFSTRDGALMSGGFGLFVRSRRDGQTTASFDELIIRGLLPTPTPTETPTPSPQT